MVVAFPIIGKNGDCSKLQRSLFVEGNAEFFKLAIQRGETDAEDLCRLFLVELVVVQRLLNELFLEMPHRLLERFAPGVRRRASGNFG